MSKEILITIKNKKMSTSDKLQKALELTKANSKGKGTGRVTALDRFVGLFSEGAKLTREEIVAKLSLQFAEANIEDFDFDNQEHMDEFLEINRKAKDQVANAIANSKNNTSLSFNPKYKDRYVIASDTNEEGIKIYWLEPKSADNAVEEPTEEVEETEEA